MTPEIHAQEARVEATFLATRPMLVCTITQHADGTWAVYTGKGRMTLCTRGHQDPATAADRAISIMQAEDHLEQIWKWSHHSNNQLHTMADAGDAEASLEFDRRWLAEQAGNREEDIRRRMSGSDD